VPYVQGNRSEQLHSLQPLQSCATVSAKSIFIAFLTIFIKYIFALWLGFLSKVHPLCIIEMRPFLNFSCWNDFGNDCKC